MKNRVIHRFAAGFTKALCVNAVVMMLLVPVVFVTGLLLYDVTFFYGLVELLGGVRVIDTVHVLIYIFFVFFIFLHVYLGSLGHTPSAHFKAMFVTGYEEAHGTAGEDRAKAETTHA